MIIKKPNERWTDQRIRKLEELWREGVPVGVIANIFGFSSVEGMRGTINRLRNDGKARLPARKISREPVRSRAIEAAAEARGVTYFALYHQLNRTFDASGPSLVDAILDDGHKTPHGGWS